MTTVDISKLPVLENTDVMAAREWFGAMSDLGLTIHADDGYEEGILTAEAAVEANHMLKALFAASEHWADPDFIYSLAGDGRFAIEKSYPGLIVDAGTPMLMRTGYQFLEGAENPTFIGEEGGQFFAIEVVQEKRLSEAWFIVSPLDGASFGPDSRIETKDATIDEGRSVNVAAFQAIDGIAEFMLKQGMAPR